MKMYTKAPEVTEALLEYLLQIFPNRLPPLTTDDRKVASLIGQQEVIEHLRSLNEQQKEE